MGYKRGRVSRSKKYSKRKVYKKKYYKRRRSNAYRLRFKPEVKYYPLNIWAATAFYNRNLATASNNLPSGNYTLMGFYPGVGTSDLTRIGDTIHPIKFWVRLAIYFTDSFADTHAVMVRIIIFTMPKQQTAGTDITGFFQHAVQNQAALGNVDREQVHKVYYDRRFIFNANLTNQNMLKFVQINIPMRKPVVFGGGSTVPRDQTKLFYIACVPALSGSTDSTSVICRCDATVNFYFYDN